MEIEKWLPLAVSLAINLLIVGIFVGSLRQTVKGLGEAIATIGRRLDEHDKHTGQSQTDRANIRARLESAEREVDEFRRIGDHIVRFQATTENELKHIAESIERLSRDMQSAQRQIANVAGMRPGVVHEFHGKDGV